MSETRSTGALRSTLIGVGALAFTFFPPTRTLMLFATLGGIMQLGAQV